MLLLLRKRSRREYPTTHLPTSVGQVALYGSSTASGNGAGVMAVDLGGAVSVGTLGRSGLFAYSANNPAIIAVTDTPNALSLFPASSGFSGSAGAVVGYMQILLFGVPRKIAVYAMS
jgi:hypothetical protein